MVVSSKIVVSCAFVTFIKCFERGRDRLKMIDGDFQNCKLCWISLNYLDITTQKVAVNYRNILMTLNTSSKVLDIIMSIPASLFYKISKQKQLGTRIYTSIKHCHLSYNWETKIMKSTLDQNYI